MSYLDDLKATLNEWGTKTRQLLDSMKPDPISSWDKNLPYTPDDEANTVMLRNATLAFVEPDSTYRLSPADGSYNGQLLTHENFLDFEIFDDTDKELQALLSQWESEATALLVYKKPNSPAVFMEETDNKVWVALNTTL